MDRRLALCLVESHDGHVKVELLSISLLCWILTSVCLHAGSGTKDINEGDIVFSSSANGQGEAIMAATGSPYTHCGIVFRQGEKWMVLEAVQPVGAVPLADFLARGKPGTNRSLRLKQPLSAEALERGRAWATAQVGKNYDGKFQWDDSRLYCSELVWKIYQHAGVELCKPRHFRDFRLEDPKVREIIVHRYGSVEALPKDEKVVAPSDLAASPLLEEVAGLR